ncbi:MAG: HAD-IC family P-type ATPase [Patescibacteria group bacterium]|jgi:Ca2+-transporting ATPase
MQRIWHNVTVKELFRYLKSSERGLSSQEVEKRQTQYGFNEIPPGKSTTVLRLIFNQINTPLVYILIFAIVVSLFLAQFTDAGVIFFIVLVNTIIGFWQENKANNAIAKLKKIIKQEALVKRDGGKMMINSKELVPGDIIYLRTGDKVPADCRLIAVRGLQIVEAALTGESVPSDKKEGILDKGIALAERANMAYMGTSIIAGFGEAIVCHIGKETEIGKIGQLLNETKESDTPLQKQLAVFSRNLAIIISVICILIFILGLLMRKDIMEMFTVSVAIAVAAIPESMLIAVTVILAFGVGIILKQKALVRKLVAAETLGSTSIICMDKTGTLTEGNMKVSAIIGVDDEYALKKESDEIKLEKAHDLMLKISVLCSNAILEKSQDELEDFKIIGDSTEKALLLAAIEAGFSKDKLDLEYPKVSEIPFDSEKKYMATLHSQTISQHDHIFAKGAPEKIFNFCATFLTKGKAEKLSPTKLKELDKKFKSLTSKGLRVIALAYKTGKFKTIENELNDLVFLGFIALKDPLRHDAKEAIGICREAGIRPVLITGDNRLTAEAIFKDLGVKLSGKAVEGVELDKWTDEQLEQKIGEIDIFARVEPRHKLRIIHAWKNRGEVVAMTGDGINDAPAIKAADIGIAMASGSDVTKEVADIVLLDSNFMVIVSAVKQGRVIFDNIRKVVLYLLASCFSEMILVICSLFLGLPLPLLAIQILWINLIADGLPNIAMAVEPAEKGIMALPPRPRHEPILSNQMKFVVFVVSIITDFILVGFFVLLLMNNTDINYVRTIMFCAVACNSLLFAFSVRSMRHSIFSQNPFKNGYLILSIIIAFVALLAVVYVPQLQNIFNTESLGFAEWRIILEISILKVFLIEAFKRRQKTFDSKPDTESKMAAKFA